MKLPEKLKSLKPYPPMTGAPSVRIDGNESCFAPSPVLCADIEEDMRDIELHRYPDPYAAEVCSLAEAFWGAPEGSAVAGNGSDELISIMLSALLPRGGKLLVCDPDFSMYRFYAALYELQCVGLERFSGVPDIGEVIEKGGDADAVILSNPCNPTGQALPLKDILQAIESLPCPVLLDEAYMDFWENGRHSALPYIRQYDHLTILKTCSKNLALAGIRLGFAFSGETLRNVLLSVKSPYNVNALTQSAGASALRRPTMMRENTQRLVETKDKLYARLSAWAQEREGCLVTDTVTNFVLLQMAEAEKVHQLLLENGISVRFLNGMLRITAGTDGETDALINILKGVKL